MLFETGYGPSGLPHIGTFGEVARTTMVRHAFRVLTEDKVRTRLLCFSDDMDGLRKVPDNVPNKEMLRAYLGKPLTRVPDPFSNEYPAFGAANNARLRAFLDQFGFDYEFASSTDYYMSGRFDATLLKMLARFDEVMAIMLPTLREERPADLFAVPADLAQDRHRAAGADRREQRRRPARSSIAIPNGRALVETPVTGGNVKLQWKADWAGAGRRSASTTKCTARTSSTSVELTRRICRVARRRAARGLQLRALPRRARPEDLQVQGQRPHHRPVARPTRRPRASASICSRSRRPRRSSISTSSPRRSTSTITFLAAYRRQDWKERSAIRSGTCTMATRRSSTCRCRSRCCSTW